MSTGRARTWLLVASLTLNVLGAGLVAFTVERKGGLRYLRAYRQILRGRTVAIEDFPAYYQHRLSGFWSDPPTPGAVVFAGDSLTDGHDWASVCTPGPVLDRGIGADTTVGLAFRVGEIVRHRPAKLFLLIGISDLRIGRTVSSILETYEQLLARVRAASPATKIYVESVLPVNAQLFGSEIDPRQITELNAGLAQLAARAKAQFVDVGSSLLEGGVLAARFTIDGVHLNDLGYQRWHEVLRTVGCGAR